MIFFSVEIIHGLLKEQRLQKDIKKKMLDCLYLVKEDIITKGKQMRL